MNTFTEINNHTETKIKKGTNLVIRQKDGKILKIFKKEGFNETLATLHKKYNKNRIKLNQYGDLLILK